MNIWEKQKNNKSNETSIFSFANWDFIYGHFPFRRAEREILNSLDGREVISLENDEYYLKEKGPSIVLNKLATKKRGEDDLTTEKLKAEPELSYQYSIIQKRELTLIPFTFSTPVAVLNRNSRGIFLGMGNIVGVNSEGYFEFTITTRPFASDVVYDGVMHRPLCDGFIQSNDKLMVYLFRPDWFMKQVEKWVLIKKASQAITPPSIDLLNADKYYSQLTSGISNQSECQQCAKKYESECENLIEFVRNLYMH